MRKKAIQICTKKHEEVQEADGLYAEVLGEGALHMHEEVQEVDGPYAEILGLHVVVRRHPHAQRNPGARGAVAGEREEEVEGDDLLQQVPVRDDPDER